MIHDQQQLQRAMRDGPALDADSPRDMGAIENALRDLDGELDVLERVSGSTVNRIDPVLRPADNMKQSGEQKTPVPLSLSPLANRLVSISSAIRAIRIKLDNANARIEL